jgi:hypothetical protein
METMSNLKMNIWNLAIITFSSAIFLCSTTFGQQPNPTSSPKSNTEPRTDEVRLTRTLRLEQELIRSEVEPRLERFQMNLRFLRAKYSRTPQENTTRHQYLWDYFPEAVITVLFVEYPAGFFPEASANVRKKKADELLDETLTKAKASSISGKDINIGDLAVKQVEFALNKQKYIARSFADKDVWYLLFAQPRTGDASSLIEKLFDSFKLVRN